VLIIGVGVHPVGVGVQRVGDGVGVGSILQESVVGVGVIVGVGVGDGGEGSTVHTLVLPSK